MEDHFGVKLQKARKRMGVSLKDASEATKIRPDFLESFETDGGKFDMPDVYKRGFIRLYAKYLKLDTQKMLDEYIAFHRGQVKKKQREDTRETYGQMDYNTSHQQKPHKANKEQHKPVEVAQIPQTLNAPAAARIEMAQSETDQPALNFEEEETAPQKKPKATPKNTASYQQDDDATMNTRRLYTKVGVIFGGSLAVFTLVAVLISTVVRSKPHELGDEFKMGPSSSEAFYESVNGDVAPVAKNFNETLTFFADGGDVDLVVRRESDKENLFSGKLLSSKTITINRTGPIRVHFSNGGNLVIQRGSKEKVRPGKDGVGWIEI